MPKTTASKNSIENATKLHSKLTPPRRAGAGEQNGRSFTRLGRGEIQLKLTQEVKSLSKEVSNLKDLEFMKVFRHPLKFMWFSFLKGLMVGFGSVLGASVLVALFIYILGQISLIPVIGDFVQDIVKEVNMAKP